MSSREDLKQFRTLPIDDSAIGLEPQDPFAPVKAMQSNFEASAVVFSGEYYDVLGLKNPREQAL